MTRVTLDRIEGDVAVCAWDGGAFELPRALLPPDAVEGDTLSIDVRREADATEAARLALAERRKRLSKDDDGGDFSL